MLRLNEIRKSADLYSYRRRDISINSRIDLDGKRQKIKLSLDPNCGGTGGRGDKLRTSLDDAKVEIKKSIKTSVFKELKKSAERLEVPKESGKKLEMKVETPVKVKEEVIRSLS